MRKEKWKKPNAYKHGVFTPVMIVPGEDPKEFIELLKDLVEEWAPEGPTEEDAVHTIAKCIWRKMRAQKYLQAYRERNSFDPKHPAYEEALGLGAFAVLVTAKPETASPYAKTLLRADKIDHLQQKVPRSNFNSAAEWGRAIANEITSVLIPDSTIKDQQLANMSALMQSAAIYSNEIVQQEVALEERLDAMIDRATRRLIQTKGMKQVLHLTPTGNADHRQQKVTIGKTSNGSERTAKPSR